MPIISSLIFLAICLLHRSENPRGVHIAVFRDGFVKPRATYSYRVHAWNTSGDSSPSNVVEVTMPPAETELPADKE